MKSLRAWWQRLANTFDGDRGDRELSCELESHLQFHIEDNLRAGLPPVEARRQALLALGGTDQTKERYRDRRGLPVLELVLRDLQDGWRRQRRTPGVALAIIVTLAATLGLNAAVFASADALVLRPFSFPNLERLVYLDETRPDGPWRGFTSAANFLEWKRSTRTFEQVAGLTLRGVELGGGDEPERLQAAVVSANFFDVIGTAPAIGRGFIADEETFGRHRSVVLGHALWMRRFAGESFHVGRSIVLDGVRHQIVGIGPQDLAFPFGSDLWLPLAFEPSAIADRDERFVLGIGVLAPGATIQAARSEMTALGEEITRRYPEANAGRAPRVQTFGAGFTDPENAPISILLQACAFLVLLIACANITSLLTAIGAERQREVAVRFALGATRGRILRGLWAESALLALLSVPLALALAALGIEALTAAMPPRLASVIPGFHTIDVDGRLMLFTAILALVAAAMFGIVPAVQASRPNPDALKEAARGLTAGGSRQRLRRSLIVAQVALVLPLLVLAASTWRGTSRFTRGPQGFDPAGMLTLRLSLPEREFADAAAQRRFTSAVLDRLKGLPAVRSATIADVLPSALGENARDIVIEGQAAVPPDQQNPVGYRVVTPDYFETLRIRILRGRGLTAADDDRGAPVAVISQSMADRYWPAIDPVGRSFRYPASATHPPGPWIAVVGVSDDVIHDWALARRTPTVYRPYAQEPARNVALAIRTTGDPASAANEVRRAIHEMDPDRPLFDVRTMEQLLSERLTGPRRISVLMGTLSTLALLLAAVGLYGVIAHLVSQRTHEIGLRVALGASRSDILRLVFGQASRLTTIGVVIGALLALASARVWENILFGIASFDGFVLVGLIILVALTGLAATYLPARRALTIDPAIALRQG